MNINPALSLARCPEQLPRVPTDTAITRTFGLTSLKIKDDAHLTMQLETISRAKVPSEERFLEFAIQQCVDALEVPVSYLRKRGERFGLLRSQFPLLVFQATKSCAMPTNGHKFKE